MRDLYNNIGFELAISATLSGATPGTAIEIDLGDFNSACFAVFANVVTDAGTTAGITWELQEASTSGGSYTAVADSDLIGLEADLAITADDDDHSYIGKLGYIGSKQFLKLIPTGTTGTDAAVTAIVTKGDAYQSPVA